MSTTTNQRQIALKKMGGNKTLHMLPREKRALALASLMAEPPLKTNSRQACFMAAFSAAVERADVLASKKLFGKLDATSEQTKAKELVSAKVAVLHEEKKDDAANTFEVAFGPSANAGLVFMDRMADLLSEAEQKLDSDYAFAHVLFMQILEKEKETGVSLFSEDAATGLAICYMHRRHVEDALNTIEKYLLKDEKLPGQAKSRLLPEIQEMMGRTSEDALIEIAQYAEKKGFMPLMQEAVLGLTSEGMFEDLERCRQVFGLMLIFGLKDNAKRLGAFLVNVDIEMADAQPDKLYNNYLEAARIAARIELTDEMDEAVDKYLAVLREIGKGKPELLGTAAFAAMEFSKVEEAKELGSNAFAYHISEGNLEEAKKIARDVHLYDLQSHAIEMQKRTEL